MFEQIFVSLRQSGWDLANLERNWVRATSGSSRRGLLFGYLSELPEQFKSWTEPFPGIASWDVIVFCPEGIDSERLKQHRFEDIQLWYWDVRLGNLFPYPPTKDQWVPRFLRQLAGGGRVAPGNKFLDPASFKPFLTYTFIGLILIYYLLLTWAGLSLFPSESTRLTDNYVLIVFGAIVNDLIRSGQVWRLLTSMFIHIGIIHLAFNVYALWILGQMVERCYGHLRFFGVYILSGLGGSIASYLFSPGVSISAGASGAIFGLIGAMLYYSYKRPALWKSGLGANLLVVVLVNFVFGLMVPAINNFAHLGGLVAGALVSLLLASRVSSEA